MCQLEKTFLLFQICLDLDDGNENNYLLREYKKKN